LRINLRTKHMSLLTELKNRLLSGSTYIPVLPADRQA
jgi:hypothetical protein